jgi:predicted phosphodiesterase
MTRLLVIGDVHGCLIELENLLWKLRYQVQQDRLVFVGDLLNKGPSGAETLSFINDLKDDGGEVIYVRGNHDEKYLQFYHQFSKRIRNGEKPPRRLCQGWLGPDGQSTISKLKSRDWRLLLETPLSFQTGNLTVLHGGLSSKIHCKPKHLLDSKSFTSKRRAEIKSLMYIRKLHKDGSVPNQNETRGLVPWQDLYDGRFGWVVYGHQPTSHVLHRGQTIGIDTACCYGNRLTALVQEPGSQIHWESVSARSYYANCPSSKRLKYAATAV